MSTLNSVVSAIASIACTEPARINVTTVINTSIANNDTRYIAYYEVCHDMLTSISSCNG